MNLKDLPIDYQILGLAKQFYMDRGYQYIEVPWIVDHLSSQATCKHEENIFILNDGKHLVGSGEQSFIHLSRYTDKIIPNKNYMTITPCFRRGEDDETHAEQFVKLELFRKSETVYLPNNSSFNENGFFAPNNFKIDNIDVSVWGMLNDANECFRAIGLTDKVYSTQLIDNDPLFDFRKYSLYDLKSYDLNFDDGLELGSYGIRRERIQKMDGALFTKYYYGTGLALPRFQLALNRFHS